MREIIAHLLGLDRELIETRRQLYEEQGNRIAAEYLSRSLHEENKYLRETNERLRRDNEYLRRENAHAVEELKKRDRKND